MVVDVEGSGQTRISIKTRRGNAEFRAGSVRYQETVKLLDGRIQVERVPAMQLVSGECGDDDYPAMAVGPGGRVWVAWISYRDDADVINLRSSTDGGEWSAIEQVTPQPGDYYQVALASTKAGEVSVVWSAIVNGAVNLYTRDYAAGSWSGVEHLTNGPGPDTFPRLATGPTGDLFLAWQSGAPGNTDISMKVRRNGSWSATVKVTENPASDWEPSIAVNSRNEAAVVWDSYRHGNYDIFLRRYAGASSNRSSG